VNLDNKFNTSRVRAAADIEKMIKIWHDENLDPQAVVSTLLAESIDLVFEMTATSDDALLAINNLIIEIEEHRNSDTKNLPNELH